MNKLFYLLVKRFRHSTVPRWVVMGMDIIIFAVAFVLTELFCGISFSSRFMINKVVILLLLSFFSFIICGTYRSIIRHTGMHDMNRIFMANLFPLLVMGVVAFVNNNVHFINSESILSYHEMVMLYSLMCVMMILSRLFCQRIYNDYFKRKRPSYNVVIYGAGAAGVIAKNALSQDLHYEYQVLAFIDDDKAKVGQVLGGAPVMKNRDVLNADYISRKKVQQLIIAIPTIRSIHKQAIVNKCLELGLTVKSVPHINNWINDSFTSNEIQDIKIEDLLERESIKLDNINVIREVVDKTVMVTGAAGSIGSEICRQLIQFKPKKIVMLDQAESPMYDLQFELKNNEPYKHHVDCMEFIIANVKDKARMEEVFEQFRPQIVYHAAAYKHVPFMEENPYEAVFVNVFGTKNLADLAVKYGASKFVMISTDKAVNPTNVMGTTKRMAEIYTQSRNSEKTQFITTRFGNVLGSNGSVIPLFKKQLAAGGPLTVTHRDIIRYFMTIPEACNLVLEAGAMGQGGDIFVFDMGKPIKIYDMAKKMIQLSGKRNIEIKEVGLRPGEKLYEELLATKENTIPTYHPKIMHAQVRRYEPVEVDRKYEELHGILATLDDMKIVEKMKEIVPEFVSNNSVYCQLDKK